MPVLDQNQNQNQTIGSSIASGAERRFRPRYNTDLFPMLAASAGGPVVPLPPYPTFHQNWDAELRACMYLDDFLTLMNTTTNPSLQNWRTRYNTEAKNGRTPPQQMNQGALNSEVMQILQLALEREDRFAEIIDQDDGDGAINYWQGMLKVDPARHPATYLMLRVGRRIGEHIVMCLKGDFLSPRPSQLCPSIVPMIDPPVTPSFPAGHAVQAYLMSYLLAYSLPKIPQQPNLPNNPTYPPPANGGPLFDLAERVSENRIVAGIHYPVDIEAGKAVAVACFKDLRFVSSIWMNSGSTALNRLVKGEFPQYA
jgi:hypothetical protein